jgi:hypothetical protein
VTSQARQSPWAGLRPADILFQAGTSYGYSIACFLLTEKKNMVHYFYMNFDTRDRSAHVDDPLMTALITDVHSDTFKLLPKRYPLVILAFIGLLFLGLFIAIGKFRWSMFFRN